MFDRYSERARRALFFARHELGQLGGTTIDPAHLLLGLLRDSKGIHRLFANRSIPVAQLRSQLEQRVTGGEKLPTSVEVPFAEATKRVLNFAAEEADRLIHHNIEPAHLLLGLLRENDRIAAAILIAYGIGLDGTREFIAARPPTNNATTAHVERIMQLVRDLAQTESNSAEGRVLVGRIDDELTMLMNQLE